MKGPHLPIGAANHNRAFAGDIKGDISATLRDLIHMANKLPMGFKDRCTFQIKQLLRKIGPARQAGAVPIFGR